MKQLGRYEILDELGRGAMGVVFKARDPLIGRLVALKTITASVADDPGMVERFWREAKAAGALQHANIVTIHDVGEADGVPFIAMEYLEGESLASPDLPRRPTISDGKGRIPRADLPRSSICAPAERNSSGYQAGEYRSDG